MESNLEDIFWIEQILNGKTERFALLVNKYKDKVFSLVMGILKNKEEAEDVAQDIFVKVFKALPKFKRKAKFSTWVYRIAYNECISRLRRQKIRTVSVDQVSSAYLDEDGNETGDWQETEIKHKTLHLALDQLSETDRGLVHLFYFDNLPVHEIARITGLSTANVKTKLFRIRKKLQEKLKSSMMKEV